MINYWGEKLCISSNLVLQAWGTGEYRWGGGGGVQVSTGKGDRSTGGIEYRYGYRVKVQRHILVYLC